MKMLSTCSWSAAIIGLLLVTGAQAQTASGAAVTAKGLEGRWKGVGYTCNNHKDSRIPEIVDIASSNGELTVTKVSGDDCVRAGMVTWSGSFTPGPSPVTFPVKYRIASGASTRLVPAKATVYDNLIVIPTKWGQLVFVPEHR